MKFFTFKALEMYQERRAKNNGKFKPLPGKMQKFTEEQLFFISFANVSVLLRISVSIKILRLPCHK